MPAETLAVKRPKHKPYFDLMRIVAIFFVIWNHTSKLGFGLYSIQHPGSGRYWLYLMASIFCTFAVPLFFMISGALVLPKANVRDAWLRRIPKQALILVGFSLAYYILADLQGDITKYATLNNGLDQALNNIPGGTSIPETEELLNLPKVGLFMTVLYSGTWNFSFWFLYAYLLFLMSAPLLRAMAEKLSNKQYLYLFGLYFVYKAVVPVINWTVFHGTYTLNYNGTLTWLVPDIVIYPLAGYFLEHRFPVRTLRTARWFLPAMWGVSLLCIFVGAAMTLHKSILTDVWNEGNTQTFHRLFNLVVAATVYLTIKSWFYDEEGHRKPLGDFTTKLLASAGSCTFGIYLLHVAVLKSDQLSIRFPILCDEIALPMPVVGLLQVIITLAICWAVTALWKACVKAVKNLRQSRVEATA